LTHTGYSTPYSQPFNSAHAGDPETCPQGQSTPPYFSKEILTTLGDLYLWDKALMSGQFLSKSAVEKMFTPYIEGHGLGGKVVKEFDRMAFVQNDRFGPASISSRIYPGDVTCILVVSHTQVQPATSVSHDLGAILFGKNYPGTANSLAPPAQVSH
jgi:CubicO group peptidase (beta-lactamase class C family)